MFINILMAALVALFVINAVGSIREKSWAKALNVLLVTIAVLAVVALVAGIFVDVEAVLMDLLVDIGFTTPSHSAEMLAEAIMGN